LVRKAYPDGARERGKDFAKFTAKQRTVLWRDGHVGARGVSVVRPLSSDGAQMLFERRAHAAAIDVKWNQTLGISIVRQGRVEQCVQDLAVLAGANQSLGVYPPGRQEPLHLSGERKRGKSSEKESNLILRVGAGGPSAEDDLLFVVRQGAKRAKGLKEPARRPGGRDKR
jgi:hypothetical protein